MQRPSALLVSRQKGTWNLTGRLTCSTSEYYGWLWYSDVHTCTHTNEQNILTITAIPLGQWVELTGTLAHYNEKAIVLPCTAFITICSTRCPDGNVIHLTFMEGQSEAQTKIRITQPQVIQLQSIKLAYHKNIIPSNYKEKQTILGTPNKDGQRRKESQNHIPPIAKPPKQPIKSSKEGKLTLWLNQIHATYWRCQHQTKVRLLETLTK